MSVQTNHCGGKTMCSNNCNTKGKKYKHLNYTERRMLERWHNRGKKSNKEIAELLGKSERTIRRELKRGKVKNLTTNLIEIEVYSADYAQEQYDAQLKWKGPKIKIGNDYEFVEYIEKGIKKGKKSPEILIKEIEINKLEYKTKVSPKTVRNWIKSGDIFNIKDKDMIYNKRYKEKNKWKKICDKIPPEKSIENRPKEANERSEYGHWEGDLVVGKRSGKGAVLFTLTERKTREEIILKLANKKAENVTEALDLLERKHRSKFYQKFKTITFDNGAEFRRYKDLEKSCVREGSRVSVYYAHPYCSGERGSNENNNRLIRRFIPKGTNINKITKKYIKEIEKWMNTLPRPMFGYKCSLEMI